MTSGVPRENLPPLRLPLLYYSFASLCFAFALLGGIRYAQDFTGFYYHPRILALTHLVTLGWITGNILGSLYLVGPMALQMRLPARGIDYAAFWLYVIGVSGMVSHFWLDRPVGMAWSASCVYLALVHMAVRVWRALGASKAPAFVKLHIRLAFANILVAGGWGFVLSIHKAHPFLPTSSSPNIFAHAHLAAVGWATMMVFGVAYRLLPMFLPGEPAKGKLPWISATLLETGAIGLFVTLLIQSAWTTVFGLLVFTGIALFLVSAMRTAGQRKPAPPPVPPQPDFSLLHAPVSFLWLVTAAITGLVLTRLPSTDRTLQLALAYGVIGLVGFLGQIVAGMKPKILSILTWYYVFTETGTTEGLPRPVDMPVREYQIAGFLFWLIGIPLFATGVLFGSRLTIVAGALALLAALVISMLHEFSILRRIKKGGSIDPGSIKNV